MQLHLLLNKNNTFKWQIIIQTDNIMLMVPNICNKKQTFRKKYFWKLLLG